MKTDKRLSRVLPYTRGVRLFSLLLAGVLVAGAFAVPVQAANIHGRRMGKKNDSEKTWNWSGWKFWKKKDSSLPRSRQHHRKGL